MANIFTKFKDYVDASLDSRIDELKKSDSVEDLNKAVRADGMVGRKGLLFDPFQDAATSSGFFKPKTSFLSNHILKHVSRRDPIVAAILDVRCSQVSSACKKQASRFDIGFKFVPKNKDVEADEDEVRKLEEYVLNCGETEQRPPEDKMTFDQWGYMVTRDLMVFGHTAIEKVRDGQGNLRAFLPLSAEHIYYATKETQQKKDSKQVIQNMIDMWQKAANPEYLENKSADPSEYRFLQVIEGKITEGFSDKELIFERINLESDIDLKGYAVGPLERAIAAITSHMQIENHQRQFFSHGTASKGVFVIQGDVTPNQLRTLQAQWNNQITGPLNAWRTPILAGIKGATWIPLTVSNRDMEYAEYMRHILVTVFSCFAMDPEEAGFGFLSKGTEQRSLSESSNEWKITASRDRGLRPILGRIEAIINEHILPEYDAKLSEKYHFHFFGLDAETQEEELQRLTAETSLHTTLGEARRQAELDPLDFGSGMILNPLYLQTLSLNMPKGLFMEKILGITGASERPDLQYVPDPLWFQWQQMQMEMMQQASMAETSALPDDGGASAQKEENDAQRAQEDGKKAPGQGKEMPNPKEQAAQQEAMNQQAEAQGMAVEQFIAGNPDLFKSFQANLAKAEGHKKIRNEHVEKLTKDLMADFDQANNRLIKEMLQIIKDDTEE